MAIHAGESPDDLLTYSFSRRLGRDVGEQHIMMQPILPGERHQPVQVDQDKLPLSFKGFLDEPPCGGRNTGARYNDKLVDALSLVIELVNERNSERLLGLAYNLSRISRTACRSVNFRGFGLDGRVFECAESGRLPKGHDISTKLFSTVKFDLTQAFEAHSFRSIIYQVGRDADPV